MQFLKRLKPMVSPVQNSAANTIYVDSDNELIKVGTGASGTAERSVLANPSSGDVLTISASAVTSTVPILAPAGSVGSPSVSFSTDSDTGFYTVTPNRIEGAIAGVNKFTFGNGNLAMTSDFAVGWTSSTTDASIAPDVSISRGAADRLDLASGDSLYLVSGGLGVGVANTSASTVAVPTSGGEFRFDNGSRMFGSTNGKYQFTNWNNDAGIGLDFSSDGQLDIKNRAQSAFGVLRVGQISIYPSTATPAGGDTAVRLLFGSTAGFGIYIGSGAPTVSAAQGSLYLRSDGSSTSSRLYVNTNGTTGWTAVTTAS